MPCVGRPADCGDERPARLATALGGGRTLSHDRKVGSPPHRSRAPWRKATFGALSSKSGTATSGQGVLVHRQAKSTEPATVRTGLSPPSIGAGTAACGTSQRQRPCARRVARARTAWPTALRSPAVRPCDEHEVLGGPAIVSASGSAPACSSASASGRELAAAGGALRSARSRAPRRAKAAAVRGSLVARFNGTRGTRPLGPMRHRAIA